MIELGSAMITGQGVVTVVLATRINILNSKIVLDHLIAPF